MAEIIGQPLPGRTSGLQAFVTRVSAASRLPAHLRLRDVNRNAPWRIESPSAIVRETSMKLQLVATLLALIAASHAAAQPAQPASGPSEARRQAAAERWKQMTPEEQDAAKAKAKARYNAMTPEQQAAMRERMAERHPQAAQRMQARQGSGTPVAPPASAPAK